MDFESVCVQSSHPFFLVCTQRICKSSAMNSIWYSGAFPPQFFLCTTNTVYINPASRLRQLLLPEPAEEARTHDDLRD